MTPRVVHVAKVAGISGSENHLLLLLPALREQGFDGDEQTIRASAPLVQEKIEKLKRMMTETEMLEAQAELQEMATGMIGTIGGSGDTLNRVEEYLTERRDKAAGRARVASSSIDTTKVELLEAEQQALADAALGEFAAAYGIDMPAEKASEAAAPAAPPAREMGPEKQG